MTSQMLAGLFKQNAQGIKVNVGDFTKQIEELAESPMFRGVVVQVLGQVIEQIKADPQAFIAALESAYEKAKLPESKKHKK